MLDLTNTILALMFIVGTLLIIAGLVLGVCAIVQNTQFYARWQRKRREAMSKKFMESLKK
jgi:uncharacterized membrane protein HdeD (DUF308 family)